MGRNEKVFFKVEFGGELMVELSENSEGLRNQKNLNNIQNHRAPLNKKWKNWFFVKYWIPGTENLEEIIYYDFLVPIVTLNRVIILNKLVLVKSQMAVYIKAFLKSLKAFCNRTHRSFHEFLT